MTSFAKALLLGLISLATGLAVVAAENGFRFYDSKTQARFIQALKDKGIPFNVLQDGTVTYAPQFESHVSAVRTTVLNDSFVPSYHFTGQDMEARFTDRLKSLGIAYGIEMRDGKRFITWSPKDDVRVQPLARQVLDGQ